MRNKLVAALFAIFLGSIGLHKFYLGEEGWGIVYLLFFWTGIPALIGFVEGILLLGMGEESFNRKYNSTLSLTNADSTRDKALAMHELKKLYDDGIITAGEYEQKRRKLLDLI
ncbi:MAG: TM2 domain-containing protein [Synechococcales cyanobacterium]